jgi:L-threonylcarbamoyladenylate synthase
VSTRIDCTALDERNRGIEVAARAIRDGKLVVLPTDTVYGIGADAFAPRAVHALLAAKGRGRDMPVPVLVASVDMLDALATDVSETARLLADECWPGALTIVATHSPALSWDLGESRGTVALRMPDNALALELITVTGPLAVSSANRTGLPPARTAEAAESMLGDDVAVYLDAGPTPDAVPSTIIDVTGEVPRLLRAGALDLDRLRHLVPDIEVGGDPGP